MVSIEFSNEGRDGWSGKKAVLANINLSNTIRRSYLYDLLNCNVVVVATVTRDDQCLTHILDFWILLVQCIENRLNEVFQVVLLREDLNFFPETASTWLLVLKRLFDLDSLDRDFAGPNGGHRPL